MNDLREQRFGRLIAIRPTKERKNGNIVWECRCDCGKTVLVASRHLVGEFVKSCGCLSNAKDLTGQKFGNLAALRPTKERKNKYVVWECRCDCGEIVLVSSSDLKNGKRKSCGVCQER